MAVQSQPTNGSPLAVGILGTGYMAQVHGQRLLQHTDARIAAICGTSLAKADDRKQQLGATSAASFDDCDTMLATTPLDALYVCLPPFAHSGQTERAAERGIHLFLEKPIAADVAQAEAMVGAIERAGVISQVGYHLRFRRAIVRLKELIDGGQAGRPTLFEGRFWCNFGGPSWWADISKSGGQAFEQLIHLYDLALYLLGSPDQASGYLANLLHSADPAYTIEDTSAGLVRFRNGSLATITGSNCAVPNAFFSDFRAVFERATLDYRSTGDWRTHDQATLYRHNGSNVEREEVTEDGDVYADETAAFLATIRGDRPPIAPAREGLNGIRLVSAVLESAQQDGLPIKLEG